MRALAYCLGLTSILDLNIYENNPQFPVCLKSIQIFCRLPASEKFRSREEII